MAGLAGRARADMRPVGIEDYRKVLELKDIDGVVVATPIPLHKEMGVAAAQAGKHCYMEKPLGRTPEEVKALYQAVKASRIRFQVGFQWRYHVTWQDTIAKIHAGEIGKIHFIQAYRHIGGYPESGWYVDKTLSGDLIVEQAVHEMNIFCWLMKGPPLAAVGFGGINALANRPPNRTIMDHYSLTYEFPEGVHLSYSHCVYMPGIPGSGLKQLVCGNQTAADLVTGTIYQGGQTVKADYPEISEPTGKALAAFVDCVRNDTEPLCNVDAGRNATLMSILGRTAIYEKRQATWKEVAL
jgi:predicted dehydrogenase